MANEQNLKPFDSNQNREKARIAGKKGGVISGQVRRARKTFAEICEKWAEGQPNDKTLATLATLGLEGEYATQTAALLIPVLNGAKNGDLKSVKMMLEYMNEDRERQARIQKLEAEVALLNAQKAKLEAERKEGQAEKSALDNLVKALKGAAK